VGLALWSGNWVAVMMEKNNNNNNEKKTPDNLGM